MADTYWSNVVLLTHCDGADASTSFVDQKGHAITAVGDAQVDTAQSMFGGASALFDGTGDSLTLADSVDWYLPGDFTIEFWMRTNNTGIAPDLIVQTGTSGTYSPFRIRHSGTNILYYGSSNDSSWDIANNVTFGTIALATWHHIAVVRSGNTYTGYVDGVGTVIATSSATPFNSTGSLTIGNGAVAYNGWLDDIRITKGVARYTSNFTPPTAAFPDQELTGAPSLLPMTAAAGAPGGTPSFQNMTVAASAVGGTPSMSLMTATGTGLHDTEARPEFEALTVAATGLVGSIASTGFSELARMEATGTGTAGSVAEGDGEFAGLSATAYGPPASVYATFESMSASGTGRTGGVSSSGVSFLSMEAAGTSVGGSIAVGAGRFAYPTADSDAYQPTFARGAPQFPRLSGAGTSLVGTVAGGAVSFEPLDPSGTGLHTVIAIGSATFRRPTAAAVGASELDATYRTWVMQADSDALTEYQNYSFDSLAEFDGAYYGAGPSGIYRLDGADDAGTDIAWTFRTGLIDGKNAMLKRLEEVLMAVRFDGPMRVRVWTDDDAFFDYNVNNYRPGVIQQVRAKLGKGLKSRFYRVEVSGVDNTAVELHSLQLPIIPLSRRIDG